MSWACTGPLKRTSVRPDALHDYCNTFQFVAPSHFTEAAMYVPVFVMLVPDTYRREDQDAVYPQLTGENSQT
jgi:hypothetical protein